MNRYRLVYLGLTLAFVALVGATWALSTGGDSTELPTAVELVAPAADATVLRQTTVVIDMVPGYVIDLTIDGVFIPPSEIESTAALGRFEWAPGPGNAFAEWAPGSHTVEVSWDTITGLPDVGSYSWGFRVQ